VTLPAGLTIGATSLVGNLFTCQINGGTAGQRYAIEVTATLSIAGLGPEVVQDEFLIDVAEITATSPATWQAGAIEFADCLKRILPYVPGCPDQTALVHLRDAAVEFCTQSLAWRAELTATTVAGVATYTIPLPAGSLLVKMLQFDVGGDTRGGMPGPSRGRDLRRGTYSRDVAWTDDRATVTLNPPPSTSGETVTLYVALKPSDEAETLPLELWQHHAKTLEHGALGTLMAMPTQPWSNPQLAGFNDDRFKTRTDSAASAAARGHSRATGRTKPFLF
jgi:hypothetical protein